MKEKVLHLEFPNDRMWLAALKDTALQAGLAAGFHYDLSDKMAQSTVDMVESIIESNPQDSEFLFNVSFHILPIGFLIEINDTGIPWDMRNIPELKPEQTNNSLSSIRLFSALGLFDKVRGASLGKKGHLLTMIKYSGTRKSDIIFSETHGTEDRNENKGELVFRRLEKLSEAVSVSKCIFRSYKYSYPNEKLYYPNVIHRENINGNITSILVEVEGSGEIVGHAALERVNMDHNVAEMGMAAVYPEYRGSGILNKLSEQLINLAKEINYDALYVHSVTSHTYSQKAIHKFGFSDCLLLLGMLPDMKFEKINPPGSERESILQSFAYIKAQPEMSLFVPERHRNIIKKILSPINGNYKFCASGKVLTEEAPHVSVEVTNYGFASVVIDGCAHKAFPQVYETIKNLCFEKVSAIYIFIPMYLPQTENYIDLYESAGCFFAGIFPGSESRCYLVLQYLNNIRIDYAKLQFDSALGKELADYIRICDPNNQK